MDAETRRVHMSLAKTFVWKRNPTKEELVFAISVLSDMPDIGYRAKGLLVTLEKRLEKLYPN
jgi:hypothetical protein